MPPKASRSDGQRRKDAILDAALRCFFEKGALGTTLDDIRLSSGASPSSIYHHFGGLPGIAQALLERSFRRMFEQLARDVRQTKTPRAAVQTLVISYLDWVLAHREEAAFLYQGISVELAPLDAEAFQAFKEELHAPLAEHIAPWIASGELPALSPWLYDVVVLGPAHEAGRRLVAGAPYLEPEWLLAELPALAWETVKQLRRRATSA